MSKAKVFILGATGLTGMFLLQKALAHPDVSEVFIWVRKTTGISHPKLSETLVDFGHLSENLTFPHATALCCCMGTTIKKAGSPAAFHKVDVTIPISVAQLGIQAGVKTFVLQSSVGADVTSGNFYLKCKGELEEAIQALGFSSVSILRPSILLGPRKEFRLGELIGKGIMRVISPLFVGKLRNYRSIQAETVADAMLYAALKSSPGKHIAEFSEIQRLADLV